MNEDNTKTCNYINLMFHMAQNVAKWSNEAYKISMIGQKSDKMELLERSSKLAQMAHGMAFDTYVAATRETHPILGVCRNPDDFVVNITEVIQNAHNPDPDVDSEHATKILLDILQSTCNALIDLYEPLSPHLQPILQALSKPTKTCHNNPQEDNESS